MLEGKGKLPRPGIADRGWTAHSILFGQHDRDHALGDRRIGRVGGVVGEALVVVVDLEEHPVAVGIEARQSRALRAGRWRDKSRQRPRWS